MLWRPLALASALALACNASAQQPKPTAKSAARAPVGAMECVEPMAPYLDIAYCDGYQRAKSVVDGKVSSLRTLLGDSSLTEKIVTLFTLETCPLTANPSAARPIGAPEAPNGGPVPGLHDPDHRQGGGR